MGNGTKLFLRFIILKKLLQHLLRFEKPADYVLKRQKCNLLIALIVYINVLSLMKKVNANRQESDFKRNGPTLALLDTIKRGEGK